MSFSNEMIQKAKTASSPEELMRMAAGEGIELTAEEAGQYYEFLHSEGELSDEELDSVAGGKGGPSKPKYRVGQKVCYAHSIYGVIMGSFYSDFQKAWYYWTLMENGKREKWPLESDACPVKVIS